MKIDSVLKKEGITIVSQLDTLQVNMLAKSISSKLCLAFPEHSLNRSNIFASLSRLNMYIADMGIDLAGAKYYYKNNSIYFNKNIPFEKLSDVAIHECLHFIQEIRDEHDEITRMGIYDTHTGLGVNEATVQVMASEANMLDTVEEKYFNISLKTISPDYYPLECALIKQIAYFTGTYPLYHSTLYSNDVFKNTFSAKTDKKTYNTIMKNLDKLLTAENELHYFMSELQYAESANTIKVLNKMIPKTKNTIVSLFFRTQNLIMKKLFSSEYNGIRSLEDIKEFQEKFYNFKDLIGSADNYTFYNELYIEMMDLLERKKEHIEANGEINLFESVDKSLIIVEGSKTAFSFLVLLVRKTRKLFGRHPEAVNINEFD